MNIAPRLIVIASLTPKGAILADIGSDHGLLLEYLLNNGIITRGYASDNKIGPYSRLFDKFAIDKRITTYMADGLEQLPNDVDTIVIAGMGGILINNILKRNINRVNTLKTLILSPHQQQKDVRGYMMKQGFMISEEALVQEGDKFYDVMRFDHGFINYDDHQLTWGPLLLSRRDPVLLVKMQARKQEIDRILSKSIPNKRRIQLEEEK
jgi:tRNA (adenine22-N1)-methyltransferase